MSLTLEIPAAIETRLRALASSQGRDLSALLLETASRAVYSLEAAARQLHLTPDALRDLADSRELETVRVEGELFIVRDARFDALESRQNERLAGLQEIARLGEEMGLYEMAPENER